MTQNIKDLANALGDLRVMVARGLCVTSDEVSDAHQALFEAIDQLEAENARLREALEKLARLGNGNLYGNSDGNMIARAALELK